MKDMSPYELYFQSTPDTNCEISNNLPDWCLKTLRSSQTTMYRTFEQTEFLTQQFTIPPFHLELVQLETNTPFTIQCQTKKNQIFMLFMLNGNIEFQSYDGSYISPVSENKFFLAHSSPGLYTARYSRGKHVVIYVRMPAKWILQVCSSSCYLNLNRAVSRFLKRRRSFRPLPHCKMDKQILYWLKEIISYESSNIGALDGLLRMRLALILERYDKLMGEQLNTLPYMARDYIHKHFKDEGLCASIIAAHCWATERTLFNRFKKEFGTTPHCYYTLLRMQYADRLITVGSKPIRDVYMDVGYKDESTFRYAYSKYLSCKQSSSLR